MLKLTKVVTVVMVTTRKVDNDKGNFKFNELQFFSAGEGVGKLSIADETVVGMLQALQGKEVGIELTLEEDRRTGYLFRCSVTGCAGEARPARSA